MFLICSPSAVTKVALPCQSVSSGAQSLFSNPIRMRLPRRVVSRRHVNTSRAKTQAPISGRIKMPLKTFLIQNCFPWLALTQSLTNIVSKDFDVIKGPVRGTLVPNQP